MRQESPSNNFTGITPGLVDTPVIGFKSGEMPLQDPWNHFSTQTKVSNQSINTHIKAEMIKGWWHVVESFSVRGCKIFEAVLSCSKVCLVSMTSTK